MICVGRSDQGIGVGVNDWEILLRFAADGDSTASCSLAYTIARPLSIDRFLPECTRRGIAYSPPRPTTQASLPPVRGLVQPSFIPRRRPKSCAEHDASKPSVRAMACRLPAAALQFAAFHPAIASVVSGCANATDIVDNVCPLPLRDSRAVLAGIEGRAIDRRRGSYRALNVTRSGSRSRYQCFGGI